VASFKALVRHFLLLRETRLKPMRLGRPVVRRDTDPFQVFDPRGRGFLHDGSGSFPVLFHNAPALSFGEKVELTRRWVRGPAVSLDAGSNRDSLAPDSARVDKVFDGFRPNPKDDGLGPITINLVLAVDASWILGRIVSELAAEFKDLGLTVAVSAEPLSDYDVVYFVPFHSATAGHGRLLDSMMVTHLDTRGKMAAVRDKVRDGVFAIALSHQTVTMIQGRSRTRGRRSDYVLLPGFIKSPPRVHLGLFFRVYKDGRKHEGVVLELLGSVDASYLHFHIMGPGWGEIVARLKLAGALVDYWEDFDSEVYERELRLCNFTLLTGRDEGAVAFLDSLSVGTPVIAPAVGYHLDYANPLVTFADGPDEIASVLNGVLAEWELRGQVLGIGNWTRYAREHLEIWRTAIVARSEK
jgi:hypothetical protein